MQPASSAVDAPALRRRAPSAPPASPARTLLVPALGLCLCAALVVGGLYWPASLTSPSPAEQLARSGSAQDSAPFVHPLVEGIKLVSSALIGLLVTLIHKQTRREKPLGRAMEQAMVLLCVSGAMMMIIIGSSLARAFGIAGAASIIRFRTPVDDPKDITVLFLLMALGMATGLGAFAVAGLGTLCLCVFLVLLDRFGDPRPAQAVVELVAAGPEFPAAHVQEVFARHGVTAEAKELSQDTQARVKYSATLDPALSLDVLSRELLTEGCGLKSVSWDRKKSA